MRLFRDLWATSPRRAAVVALLVVLGAGGQAAAAALAGPVLLYRSVGLFVVLALALLANVLSDLGVGLITARLTADWAAGVRRQLCGVALGQDLPTLETTPVGELLDRIDGDVNQVASELRGSGVRIAQSLAVGGLSIVVALVVWVPAGLGMLALTAVLTALLRNPTRRIGPARMAEEEAWSDLAAVMEESIHGQDDVRTSLARPYVLRMFAQRASQVLARARRVWTMSARVATTATGMIRAGIAVVVVTGVWALVTGRIDGARLTAVWLLALAFGETVEHMSRMVPELQYALGAWGRVQLLRGATQEPAGGVAPADGDLAIRGLTFRYRVGGPEAAGRAALRDVRLTFSPGRSYALIGRSGSGKSTLAKVLTRAVDVPRGTVFLGGTDLCELDLEGLRRWVAIVPQRTEILAGTLAENIALFDPELLDQAGRALDELGLASWVADLPDGLATKLGEGGHVLSAGQEQLVAFARILVRDPHVVILDEATARMDPVTEAWVQRATERLLRDRIGILIAHRLSSVRRCDEVVVMAEGAVVEAGPLHESRRFAQLLASSHAATATVGMGAAGVGAAGVGAVGMGAVGMGAVGMGAVGMGAVGMGAVGMGAVGVGAVGVGAVGMGAVGVDGFDTDGLDTDGLDTDGLDTDGLDTDGLDTDGLDTVGVGAGRLDVAGAGTGAIGVLAADDGGLSAAYDLDDGAAEAAPPDGAMSDGAMSNGAMSNGAMPNGRMPDRVPASMALTVPPKAKPPALPEPAPARTMREILRLTANDPRYGVSSMAMYLVMALLGLDGCVLPWLWADLVDGRGGLSWPAAAIVAGLLLIVTLPYYTNQWFPEWWVRQMLRISLRLVHGQTGPRRVSAHTPAEVVAQGGDTERVVMLADNLLDQFTSVFVLVAMTVVARSPVPGLFFAGTMLLSGLAATLFAPRLDRAARRTVAARAAFATALVSSLSAARTVKLAAATRPVLAHLARLDAARSERQRREISVQVWARSTPSLASGLLPAGAWALYLTGGLSSGATLVAVSTLGAASWFAWTTASLISQLPSARV